MPRSPSQRTAAAAAERCRPCGQLRVANMAQRASRKPLAGFTDVRVDRRKKPPST